MSRFYYHLKPEAALNNAEDMIKVGKKEAALECLADLMKSRRLKNLQQASNKVLEEVMRRISNLCVEMRNTTTFKEVVHQYKNMIASVNPKSLEDIVLYYLAEAKQKTDDARSESRALVLDVDDLEIIETPESLMMRSVSMDGAQERSDRTILAPWLKFLWESYRMILELLRNNKKFERLYHNVAKEVFKMCINFTRKAEFRKLCDWLRKDLGRIQTQLTSQPTLPGHAVNLTNPDTQAMHLETRLEQLDCAFTLEQFSEAYKTIEDIWGLISLNKKMAKPSIMSNYYMKLAEIFYRCDTMLFHAATLVKHFLLAREMKKNMSQEELHTLASRVYCAILAIPLTGQREHNLDYALDGNESLPPYKQKILSNVIGLSSPPTREQLVKDLVRLNINHLAHPELTKLYQYMEVDFHPLQLNKRVRPALEFIADQPTLKPYLSSLQNILVVRTLLQCSQVYQCLRLDKFIQLCSTSQILDKRGHDAATAENGEAAPETNSAQNRQLSLAIENIIVCNVYQLELAVRLDLREGILRFNVYNDSGIGTHQLDSSDLLLGPTNESRQTSWPISESVCGQLASLCCALHQVVEKLEPLERNAERIAAVEYAVQAYRQGGENHHKRLLDRKILIEERKVAQEAFFDQITRQEQYKREIAEQRLKDAEKSRREKEQKEREQRKIEEETRRLQEQIHRENLQNFLNKGLQGVSEAKIASMNPDELLSLEIEEQKRRFTEKAERARLLERKQDYLIRALNFEEQPILLKESEANPKIARERYEEARRLKEEKARVEHASQLADKDRLGRMASNVEEFLITIRQEAENAYEKSLIAWEAECEKERLKILNDQREKRKEERKSVYIQRKLEERERQIQLEKQKREEEELEEIRKVKQASVTTPQPAPVGGRAPLFIAGARTEGGWRQREQEKQSEWRSGRTDAASVNENRRGEPTRNLPPPTNEERYGTPAAGQLRRNVPSTPMDCWRRGGDTNLQEQPQSTDRSGSGFGSGSWQRGNPPSTPVKKESEYVIPAFRQQQQQATLKQSKERAPQSDADGWSTVGTKRSIR